MGNKRSVGTMNCFWCQTELIVSDNIDIDESMDCILFEEYSVRTNLTCPKCYSDVEVLKKRDAYD